MRGILQEFTSRLVLILLVTVTFPSVSVATEDIDSTFVEMEHLISTPSKFDGRRIRTIGAATIGFEDDAIFQTKEHAEKRNFSNAILIRLPSDSFSPWPEFQHLAGKYVLIEGVFRKPRPDEGILWSKISEVTRLYAVEDKDNLDQ